MQGSIKKIAVLLPKYIGDSIMATPALQLIQQYYPDAEITVICRKLNTDLFARGSYRALTDPRDGNKKQGILQLVNLLKREQFDLGFLFSNTLLDALIFKMARVGTIVGYNKEGRGFLLDYSEKIDRARHYINHYAHLVNAALKYPFEELPPTAIAFEPENSRLQSKQEGTRYIGVYFGGSNKGDRHYPNALAAQTLQLIHERSPLPCHFLIFGDPSETASTRELIELLQQTQTPHTDLVGQTSIIELVDTIATVDLLLTIDSSPLHIAAAVGTPIVVLVGHGTSPWSVVEPKTEKHLAVKPSRMMIDNALQIAAIQPKTVTCSVLKALALF